MEQLRRLLFATVTITLAACAGYAATSTQVAAQPPFGGPADTAYAAQLWNVLAAAKFVGPGTILTYPYKGKKPHGAVLEFIQGKVAVNGHSGVVMVKKNYGGKNIDDEDVFADPGKYLKSITVMFKRAAGYDPQNQDWFWVKYAPDGSLKTNPKGMKLAGRVAKGMSKGCIACHKLAPGNDYVWTHDRLAGS
ncbi:MAG: cytochrome P460 family protein [Alphaproteobacteria bacterium]